MSCLLQERPSRLKGLIISAPFGNWRMFQFHNATATLGTFTAAYRGGLMKQLWRVLTTVRYNYRCDAWTNRLGLPNKGIDWFVDQCRSGHQADGPFPFNKIISIMGFNTDAWLKLFEGAGNVAPMAIEMNVSCPNCPGEDQSDYKQVFKLARTWIHAPELIVKLPPVDWRDRFRMALDAGITSYHAFNTFKTSAGGMSGKPLQPFVLQGLEDIRNIAERGGYKLRSLIAGGGVTCWEDAEIYLDHGATNVAVASTLFFPWRWKVVQQIADRLARKE